MVIKSNTMPAGKFKAQCLAILDEVRKTRRSVVVTKRGTPVARVVPVVDEASLASLQGSIISEGDIVSPLGEDWSATK
jgi:prevent-host-death family protein